MPDPPAPTLVRHGNSATAHAERLARIEYSGPVLASVSALASAQHAFDALTEADLRRRQSAKWKVYGDEVLPAWVAEMDFPIAEPIRRALHAAIDAEDVGYADPRGLGNAAAPWALASWRWAIAPGDVHMVADVVTGIGEVLRVATAPGDAVLIEPPVYHPFSAVTRHNGRVVVEAPLRLRDGVYAPDLDAIERAYASGARVHLLCSPHNPSGMAYSEAELARIAELADHHRVLVISDEIHAPLTLRGATHRPFPSVSAAAARCSIVMTSASKTWNLAGLKAAMMIACGERGRTELAKLPPDTPYHAGHLGVLASRAALSEGQPWLTSTLTILERNRALLGELLAEHLPRVRWQPQRAGYLAWLDCRELGLGDDPARAFLQRGKVALSSGPMFGEQGKGFARLNVATSRGLLEEAVRRMARALEG
ncbi:MAG: aminotransferase class I/II-fold pyridoxal phosphate-dependent enzyme [Myxococcales bacterium]|nr:aminotransferase class I/II-fold pyridoxal phosphate-dependent enzyme [Myxococcales bacterium]